VIGLTWEALTTIVVLAIIVEFSTEIFKSIFPSVRGQFSKAVAVLLGVILCVSTRSGILASFNIYPYFPQIDYFLTGIIISRGSNIIHDMVSRLELTKARP
jgi:type IV secretory pathway VirB2 component (pilin)